MLSAILLRHSSGVLTCCEMWLPISESDDRAELSDCVVWMTVSASGVTGSMARHEETATEPLIKTRNSSWKQVASLTHVVCIYNGPWDRSKQVRTLPQCKLGSISEFNTKSNVPLFYHVAGWFYYPTPKRIYSSQKDITGISHPDTCDVLTQK